jgi:hypothetical protein
MGESTTGGSSADDTTGGSGNGRSAEPGRSPDGAPALRPFWRRGSVWFLIIVVEVVVATIISLVFARDPGEVSRAAAATRPAGGYRPLVVVAPPRGS